MPSFLVEKTEQRDIEKVVYCDIIPNFLAKCLQKKKL